MNRREVGERGEVLAGRFLEAKGYRLLERNYRSRLGEIDLVCRDGQATVFVEVKTRTSDRFGHPAEAVIPRKQAKLRRLAQEYLVSHKLEDSEVRFDVLSVRLDAEPPTIEHLAGAF